MVEAMDGTAQIIWLSSGPIWQFFGRTCQIVTTDNHALCATNRQLAHLLQKNQTNVHAGGWTMLWIGLHKFLAVLCSDLAVFRVDMSEKTTDNHALCATNKQLAHLMQQNHTSVLAGGW